MELTDTATEAQALEALKAVIDPDLGVDIVTLGFVKDLKIEGGRVAFQVELTTPACPVKEVLEAQCRDAVAALPGVKQVEIEMTARVRQATKLDDLLPGVAQVIAVASGKGGVGKSTVAVNLAIALAKRGAKVGLLDADVYGPSIPLMIGCANERPMTTADKKILPIERFDIKTMSLGYLLEEGQAVLWRGPMVAGTVKQLLADVNWGELDYLIVDLPPGTGDAPMSLAQLVPLTGVVIVTTPHNVASNIAGKAAALFTRLNTPILGVVENMASFTNPETGESIQVFAGRSGEELAKELDVAYLGSIPLDPRISHASDEGQPSIVAYPDTAQAREFGAIAERIAARASVASHSK